LYTTKFVISPNPNSGRFKIETAGIQSGRINIFTLFGELVYHSETLNTDVDLSDQAKGTYFLEILVNDQVYNQKLIVQ